MAEDGPLGANFSNNRLELSWELKKNHEIYYRKKSILRKKKHLKFFHIKLAKPSTG